MPKSREDPVDFDTVSDFAAFASAGGLALGLALLAVWRERRDRGRAELDRVSLVSWNLLSVLFSMLAIILLATAAKFYFAPGG